jgi:hypothetical protein
VRWDAYEAHYKSRKTVEAALPGYRNVYPSGRNRGELNCQSLEIMRRRGWSVFRHRRAEPELQFETVAEIPFQTGRLSGSDVRLISRSPGGLKFQCGTKEPCVIIPTGGLSLPANAGLMVLNLKIRSTESWQTLISYDWGGGFNAAGTDYVNMQGIPDDVSDEKGLVTGMRIEIKGWATGMKLKQVRLGLPKGSVFTIEGMKIETVKK